MPGLGPGISRLSSGRVRASRASTNCKWLVSVDLGGPSAVQSSAPLAGRGNGQSCHIFVPTLKADVDVVAMNASQQPAAAAAEPVVTTWTLSATLHWNALIGESLFVSRHGGLRRLMEAWCRIIVWSVPRPSLEEVWRL